MISQANEIDFNAKLVKVTDEVNERQKHLIPQKVRDDFDADLQGSGSRFGPWPSNAEPRTLHPNGGAVDVGVYLYVPRDHARCLGSVQPSFELPRKVSSQELGDPLWADDTHQIVVQIDNRYVPEPTHRHYR